MPSAILLARITMAAAFQRMMARMRRSMFFVAGKERLRFGGDGVDVGRACGGAEHQFGVRWNVQAAWRAGTGPELDLDWHGLHQGNRSTRWFRLGRCRVVGGRSDQPYVSLFSHHFLALGESDGWKLSAEITE